MNKDSFKESFDFEQAQEKRAYSSAEQTDSKLQYLCLKDTVILEGKNSSNAVGWCEIETCAYFNDKLSGAEGYCLKKAVGVAVK